MMDDKSSPVEDSEVIEISSPVLLPSRPRLSVYMATYNHEGYVAQAIESVLAQQVGFSFELIIGEDCSTDKTPEIVREYQLRHPQIIRIITARRNVGAFQNAKRCRSQCKGEFIAHLNGDDYWLPGKLQRQVNYLDANPDCAAVYTNALTVSEDGDPIGLFNDVRRERFDLAALLRRGNFLNTSSMVYRSELRQLLEEIAGPFIDYNMHLRFARRGFLAQLDQPLAAYRVDSAGSMVSGANDWVRNLYWQAILDVPRELVTDDDFAHGIADFLRRVVFRVLRTRRWTLLREWVPRVFEASPCGTLRTGYLVLASAVRVGWKEAVGRLSGPPDSRGANVLYRR